MYNPYIGGITVVNRDYFDTPQTITDKVNEENEKLNGEAYYISS